MANTLRPLRKASRRDPALRRISAQQIHDARRELGLTLEQLAERIGWSVTQIKAWEAGRSRAPHEAVLAIEMLREGRAA